MSKGEKTKLPKILGGFKLARALRKAEAVEELMSTATGRALLVDALASAGAAASAALRSPEGGPKQTNGAAEERLARQDAAEFIATAIELFVTEARSILAPLPADADQGGAVSTESPASTTRSAPGRSAKRSAAAPDAAPAKTPRPRRSTAKATSPEGGETA